MTDRTDPPSDLADDARRDADPIMDAGVAAPGYRLPADTRLGHVSLQVADLARSVDWYERVPGLKVLEESGSSAMLGATVGGTSLVRLTERAGASPSPHHARLGLYHFAILLPERAALGRFIVHLGEVGAQAGAADHVVSEALYLHDPDGLGIEVYADRPRSAWRAHKRQIAMASDPLDVADVVRSAGDTRWAGMPMGTVMGHVHLHVADMARAAEFYHTALGLHKMVWDYPGALFLAAGGYHHHLGLNTWAGARAPSPTGDDARLLEWRIVLSSARDVQKAAASLAAAGHVVTADGGDCIAADPWGTRLRLALA